MFDRRLLVVTLLAFSGLVACGTPDKPEMGGPSSRSGDTGVSSDDSGPSEGDADAASEQDGGEPKTLSFEEVESRVGDARRIPDEYLALMADDPREPETVPSRSEVRRKLNSEDKKELREALANSGLSEDQSVQMLWLASHRNTGRKLDRVHQRHRDYKQRMRQAVAKFADRLDQLEENKNLQIPRKHLRKLGVVTEVPGEQDSETRTDSTDSDRQ